MSEQVTVATVRQNGKHCKNLPGDRRIGEYWERQFCIIAAQYGKIFTPMQIGRTQSAQAFCLKPKWNHHTLPDVTIWAYPGEHHEIKHKNPTFDGMFGLEVYRFDDLMWFTGETHQVVMYTIHNHDLAGGRDVTKNKIEHWVTVNVADLNGHWSYTRPGSSWVNGIEKTVDTYYWSQNLWIPLSEFWK